MTREEKIKMAIEKGYTCNPETGEVFGVKGGVIKNENIKGYRQFSYFYKSKKYNLYQHQFIWYCVNKEVVDCLDHINGVKNDNRIENLRSVSIQKNNYNRYVSKGYQKNNNCSTFRSYIKVNKDRINLGSFKTEEEAREAYLKAKQKYHQI